MYSTLSISVVIQYQYAPDKVDTMPAIGFQSCHDCHEVYPQFNQWRQS